eukprot:scaffold23639_cov191-Amphora_coffeaeformis.AAC.6
MDCPCGQVDAATGALGRVEDGLCPDQTEIYFPTGVDEVCPCTGGGLGSCPPLREGHQGIQNYLGRESTVPYWHYHIYLTEQRGVSYTYHHQSMSSHLRNL